MPNRSVARFVFALALAGSLAACAHTAPVGTPAPHKDVAPVSQTDTYRAHEISELPHYTPEEVGRRFLKLADSLTSFDRLSLDFARSTTALPFAYAPLGKVHAFGMHLPESGWYYTVDYREDPIAKTRSIGLVFANDLPGADMFPVCSMDLKTYVDRLTELGYSLATEDRDHLGRLYQRHYVRNDVLVLISERWQADAPESKKRHACLERISIVSAG